MTIGEILRECKGIIHRINFKRQEKATYDYTLAILIGSATVGALSKENQFPSIEEAYPEIFKDNEKLEEARAKKEAEASIARFIQFANQHNAKFNSEEQ